MTEHATAAVERPIVERPAAQLIDSAIDTTERWGMLDTLMIVIVALLVGAALTGFFGRRK